MLVSVAITTSGIVACVFGQAYGSGVPTGNLQRLGVNQLQLPAESRDVAPVVVPDVVPVVQTVQTVPNLVPNPYGLDSFFACIAWRESRDDPKAVNASSGAGGLFQFLPSTWANIGGVGLPQDADVPTQIAMAQRLREMQGTSPWAGQGYTC